MPTRPAIVERLRKGDVFTIEGRYAFNPITRQETDVLQVFTVIADVTGETIQAEMIWPSYSGGDVLMEHVQ